MMVGEYGAQERAPGEKARWVTDARVALKTQFPGIRAVIPFDADKDYDWRMDTSAETLQAYRDMAADPWFNADRGPLIDRPSVAPAVSGIPLPIPPPVPPPPLAVPSPPAPPEAPPPAAPGPAAPPSPPG